MVATLCGAEPAALADAGTIEALHRDLERLARRGVLDAERPHSDSRW